MLKLSFVIPTYNRASALPVVLNSILQQTLTPSEWECVVVNNASTDDSEEVLKAFCAKHSQFNFSYINESKAGAANARNAGVDCAVAPIVAFIDDDEQVVEGYAAAVVDFFERHSTVNIAGGACIPRYEQHRPQWLSPIVESPIAFPLDFGENERIIPRRASLGSGNMMVRRTAFIEYGGFDTSLGRSAGSLAGGEDFEFVARLRAAGEKVWWIPQAKMYHIIPPAKLERQYLERLWRGIGKSKKQRAKNEVGFSWWIALAISEIAKWGAVALLSIIYTLQLNPQKAKYLILMRWYVGLGLIS